MRHRGFRSCRAGRLSAYKLICSIRYELICGSRESWCQPPRLTKVTLAVLTPISTEEDGPPTCCSIRGLNECPSIQEATRERLERLGRRHRREPTPVLEARKWDRARVVNRRYAIGTALRHRRRATRPSSLSSVEQIHDRARTQISASRGPPSLYSSHLLPGPNGPHFRPHISATPRDQSDERRHVFVKTNDRHDRTARQQPLENFF